MAATPLPSRSATRSGSTTSRARPTAELIGVARALHSSDRSGFAYCIARVGKCAAHESRKQQVNEDGERDVTCRTARYRHCEERSDEAVHRSAYAARCHHPRNRAMTSSGARSHDPFVRNDEVFKRSRRKRKCPGPARACRRVNDVLTPGWRSPCRARPARRRGARSARGRASTRRSRARPRGRTRRKRGRRHARRRCRPSGSAGSCGRG